MAAAAPEFERVVRDAMDAKDLSLVALARASGIDRGRWYAWFRGENAPQPRTLTRAAHILGLDVGTLLAPFAGQTKRAGIVTDPALSPLLAALAAQTESITALVGELRSSRQEVAEVQAEMAGFREALAELAGQRAEAPTGDPASGPPEGAPQRGRRADD